MSKPINGIDYIERCPICGSKTKIVCYSDGHVVYTCNNRNCKNKFIKYKKGFKGENDNSNNKQ